MPRAEAERLVREHPACDGTVQVRCHHCGTIREFYSSRSPEGSDRIIDMAAYALDAGLRAAGYDPDSRK